MTTDKAETELLLQLATKVHGWVETVQAIQRWQDSTERRVEESGRQVHELTRMYHNLLRDFEALKRENASNGKVNDMKQYGALILGTPLTGTIAVNILRGQLSIAVVEDHTTITLDELQTAELRNWLNEELE